MGFWVFAWVFALKSMGFCYLSVFAKVSILFMTVRSGNEVRVKSRTALFKKSTGMDTNKAVICCSALGTQPFLFGHSHVKILEFQNPK